MPPLVSIIIPAYNSAGTIVEALESVAAQTSWAAKTLDLRLQTSDPIGCEAPGGRGLSEPLRQDGSHEVRPPEESNVYSLKSNVSPAYEVLIVDDCSTDATVEVVKTWLGKNGEPCNMDRQDEQDHTWKASFVLSSHPENPVHPFVSLQSNVYSLWSIVSLPTNGGPAKARNRGIRGSTGEWIAFLDSDDVWLPHKLELQIRLAAEHPDVALWSACAMIVCGSEGMGLPDGPRNPLIAGPAGKTVGMFVPEAVLPREMAMQNRIGTSNVLVRKSVLDVVGGFDEGFRGPEDYDLWLRIVARYPARIIPATLTLYRERRGSLSADDEKFLPQVLRVLDKAFGPGGALYAYPRIRRKAYASQYLSAGRMALATGARRRALQYLLHAWLWDPLLYGKHQPALWFSFLLGSRRGIA